MVIVAVVVVVNIFVWALFDVEVHIKFSCDEYIGGAECSYGAVSWEEETRGRNT